MKAGELVYVYWPVLMAAFVVLIGCVYDAPEALARSKRGESVWPPPINLQQAPEMLSSPVLWISLGCLLAGLVLAEKAAKSFTHQVSATERFCMVWHLTNACFYHTFCDVCSGLFNELELSPLARSYRVQNDIHQLPRHHHDRVVWDTVYWFELLFETPLALIVFYLYLTQSKLRYTCEAFLHGAHFAGFIAYYIPDLILGHTPHLLISNIDRLIACAWVVVPFCLLARSLQLIANDQTVQHIKLTQRADKSKMN